MKAGNIQGDPFRGFVEAIVSGDNVTAIRLLDASPLLAKERAAHGATRQGAKQSFFDRILHYMYEGDTALHMAAAAYQTFIAEELIARGADVRAGTDAAQKLFKEVPRKGVMRDGRTHARVGGGESLCRAGWYQLIDESEIVAFRRCISALGHQARPHCRTAASAPPPLADKFSPF